MQYLLLGILSFTACNFTKNERTSQKLAEVLCNISSVAKSLIKRF